MTRLVAAAKPNCSEHCQTQFCKQQQNQATSHPSSLQQKQQSIMNLYHWNQLLEPWKPQIGRHATTSNTAKIARAN